MSDPAAFETSENPAKASPGKQYEALPNVTPPSASFLLQLFLIPMLIVSIIVALWMGFSWMAHLGANPEDLIADVEKLNDGSWQRALTLADLLRNPQYDHLKDDPKFAERLATVLQKQLDAGALDKDSVNLRLYLARVLGEFRTPVVLPALVQAATLERDAEVERTADPQMWFPKEIDVRRAAIESFAVLAGSESLGPDVLRNDPTVMQAILDNSREMSSAPDPNEDRPKLRQTAAFTLGVVGGQQALDRLAVMLGDPFPNARYNAAVGLARHGDPRAVEGLAEMLDPENEAAVASEISPGEKKWKRGLIMMNALRAAKQLEEQAPQADLSAMRAAAEKLLLPQFRGNVQLDVQEAAQDFVQRPPTAKAG